MLIGDHECLRAWLVKELTPMYSCDHFNVALN